MWTNLNSNRHKIEQGLFGGSNILWLAGNTNYIASWYHSSPGFVIFAVNLLRYSLLV